MLKLTRFLINKMVDNNFFRNFLKQSRCTFLLIVKQKMQIQLILFFYCIRKVINFT